MAKPYRNRASLIVSAAVFVAVLCVPWPDARGPLLFKSIAITFADLHKTAVTTVRRIQAFQSDLNTPGSGEHVLPLAVQDTLAILRGRGRAVKTYQLSESLTADEWVLQQMIASVWPRKLEKGAMARFVLNTDPVVPGCTVIDKRSTVSLVYCP
jgi:hypothetical protein